MFKQPRPGKKDNKTGEEKIFYIYKFRTMTNKRDSSGDLLPDEERLTKFGLFLRRTSLDELLELFNILEGNMSFVGPRPFLIEDLIFMSKEERLRHTVLPGLSGLAQVNGRNNINWDDKFSYDLKYIEDISFKGDLKILFLTLFKVFITKEGAVVSEEYKEECNLRYGDFLLKKGRITQKEYDKKLQEYENYLKINGIKQLNL